MKMREIGDCTLILGDCREVMEEAINCRPVGAVVTDPPYGIKADENPVRGKRIHHVYGFDLERPAAEVFDLMRRISGDQIIWGGNYFADMLPPSMRWLIWDKIQGEFSLADCELAWCSVQGAARIFRYARGRANMDGKCHPTQKPLALMEWCLGFVPNAEIIMDPFMGSGTTGVACVRMRRKFVGVEVSEEYFEIACKRIRDAHSRGDFLPTKPRKTKQGSLL